MSASITTELRLAHPPERVWRALTTAERIADWLMPNDFAPVVGRRFTFRTRPIPPHFDGVVHCEVRVVDPPRRLEYTWQGGGVDTVVSFRLEADGDGGTTLHFAHGGFDLDRMADRSAYQGMSPGWRRHMASGLAKVLAALAAS